MRAWTVILLEAQGPLNLVGPTRKDLAAGTSSVADQPLAPHAAVHASMNAFPCSTENQLTSVT